MPNSRNTQKSAESFGKRTIINRITVINSVTTIPTINSEIGNFTILRCIFTPPSYIYLFSKLFNYYIHLCRILEDLTCWQTCYQNVNGNRSSELNFCYFYNHQLITRGESSVSIFVTSKSIIILDFFM